MDSLMVPRSATGRVGVDAEQSDRSRVRTPASAARATRSRSAAVSSAVRLEQGGAGRNHHVAAQASVDAWAVAERRSRSSTRCGTLTRLVVGRVRIRRGALQHGLGRDGSVRDVQPQDPGHRARLRGLRPRVPSHRDGRQPEAPPQPRRQAPRRAAGVQRGRHDQGHREARRVRDALGALRFVGRLVAARRTTAPARSRCSKRCASSRPCIRIRSARSWSATGAAKRKAKSARRRSPRIIPRCSRGCRRCSTRTTALAAFAASVAAGWYHSPEHINDWLARSRRSSRRSSTVADRDSVGQAARWWRQRRLLVRVLRPAGVRTRRERWDYGTVTWHTERDTYDKVVFDDLKCNATLTAMLAYLASEDPTRIPLDRVDLAAQAANAGRGGGGRGFG